MELNDELLCAYLDGELDETARTQLTRALETDAGGRVRLERMRVADARLRREMPPQSRPASDPIADFIRRHEAGAAVAMPARRRWIVPGAIAAAAATITFAVLFSSRGVPPVDSYAEGALQAALETRPGGVAGGAPVAIVMTLRTRDGTLCRLFESRTGTAAEGLACRDEAGWKIVAWDATVFRGEGYKTAGASPMLDAAMDRLGAEPLDAAAERAALEGGWKSGAR